MEQQAKAPKDIRNVVNFLRSSAGMETHVGLLDDKRVDYFKGKAAIKAVLSPAYTKLKDVPRVTNENEARNLIKSIIPYSFFLRVDHWEPRAPNSGLKCLTLNRVQVFRSEDLYAWIYEGPMWTMYLGGFAMVAALLAGVMFPLWPQILRLGAWYISVGVLGLIGMFIAIVIFRLIFYIITAVVTPPGIWVFPKLLADVGVIETFIPLYEWDLTKKKKSHKHCKEESVKKKRKGKATMSVDSDMDTPVPLIVK